jgi:gliding motility-associated-like protein
LNLTINSSTTSEETATACDSYTWNGTEYSTSGVYTFESENEAGCTNTATLNLTISSSTTSEETATACDSYTWNGTEYSTSGVYTFESENEAGCTNTATLNLTINSSTTSEETATACDSYTWNGTEYSTSGVYTFESENEAGCTNTATLNLTINATPEVSISGNSVLTCANESIVLTASATIQGTANYLWNTGATTATIEVTESGEYSVTVTSNNSDCSAMDTVTVTENISETEASITGNEALTCLTESITLDASGTSVQGTPSYEWNTGATTPTIVVTAPGEYSVIVTGSDNGCAATATTTVSQNVTPPVVSISGNEALTCSVTSITLDASGTSVQGMATYLWNTGETTPSIVVNEAEDYTVAVTDSNNGCSGALTITVTENYDAVEVAGGSVALCITDVSLDLTTLLISDFVSEGTWTDDLNSGGFTGSSFDPSIVNLGDYQFTYTEPGDCGRIITIAVNVNDDCVVLACSTEDMIISKVVTPNNDGFNDNFEITGLDGCDFTFGVKIFNRWGKIVYQSENYQNNWNGRHDGSGISIGSNNELPTGTYYYILTVSGGTGFKPMTGYIYLGTH